MAIIQAQAEYTRRYGTGMLLKLKAHPVLNTSITQNLPIQAEPLLAYLRNGNAVPVPATQNRVIKHIFFSRIHILTHTDLDDVKS
jgi:hypothetical protein